MGRATGKSLNHAAVPEAKSPTPVTLPRDGAAGQSEGRHRQHPEASPHPECGVRVTRSGLGTPACGGLRAAVWGGGGRRAAQWLPNPGKDGLGRACGTETNPDGGSGFLRTRTPVPREAHLPPTSLPHPPPVSDTNQRQSDSVFLTPESSDPRIQNSLSQWILPRQRPEGPSLLSGRPSCLGPCILEIPGIPHVCPSRANDTGLMPMGCHPRIPNDGILFPLRTAGQVRPPAAATAAFLLLLPRHMCHSQ